MISWLTFIKHDEDHPTGVATSIAHVSDKVDRNILKFLQELQRRLDCTIGKPGSFSKGRQDKAMTVGARLVRLENMVREVEGG